MWSIYLGNKDAFIDGNINLVRNDKDLIIPSYSSISETSHTKAKASILAMNESYSLSIAPAVKSLLVLTAPKIIEAPEQKVKEIVDEDETKKLDINNEELNDPADIIKNNTKTLEMAFESKVVEELIKETEDIKSADIQEFGLMDLLFVAFVSILSGILIALIYIQLKSRQTKRIDYDFDEAPDTSSSVAGLPKGLSITNNEEEQQLDLAVTYFEMGDLENSKSILDELMKSTQSDKIRNEAKTLLDKFSEK
jgi:FimV-like protein